ncbi:MAG: protein kinase [bacterium]|nr:protein kinase [bacterium]
MTACLSDSELHRYHARELESADGARVQEHLAACEDCARRSAELAAGHDALVGQIKAAAGSETIGLPPRDASGDKPPSSGGAVDPPDHQRLGHIEGYEIIREIHRGGQGVVHEAIQRSTKRTVAIKTLLDGPFADDSSIARLRREVELIAALKHPNIVVVHDSGVAHRSHFFVMDYVSGVPLDDYVRAAKHSLREIVELFHKVCDAVAFAHRHGVIHRDLKPSNILVDEDGTPYVLDFGMAKAVGEQGQHTQLSRTGWLMGTLRYMSPEQTLGDPAAIDVRSDVYSLGVILYELLTGLAPYDTCTDDMMEAVKNIRVAIPTQPSKHNRRIGTEVEAIILQAIHKAPERRYQSAAELVRDLSAWSEGRPVAAKSSSSLYVVRKLAAKHAFATAVVGSLLVTVLSFSAISYDFYRGARQAAKDLATVNRAVTKRNQTLTRTAEQAKVFMWQQALGWFLLEWHAGRVDRAQAIQAQTAKSSPEYGEAMAFLLNDTYSLETLRDRLPQGAAALLHFATAERALKGGQLDEAVREYELVIGITARSPAGPQAGGWLRVSARARLDQLGHADPTTQAPPASASNGGS